MKKYIALGLLSSLIFTSCGSELNNTKEKSAETTQQEHPVTQKKLESTTIPGSVGSGNTTETGSGNTTEISKSTTSSGSQTVDLIPKEKTKEAEYSEFISGLLDIEKNGITVPLIDEKEFNNFVNDNSGSVFIGNEEDWKRALEIPCTETGANISVYNQFAFDYDGVPKLGKSRYCFSGSLNENQQSVSELFSYLKGLSTYTSFLDNINTEHLKSNLESYPSKPSSPLERLIASQIFASRAVQRFIVASPYKNEILTLYTESQEPGIPGFRIGRIYLKDEKLYIKDNHLDPSSLWQFEKVLDKKYGEKFKLNLGQDSYDIEGKTESPNGRRFNNKEVRLLKGDSLKSPSVIQQKIEERLINDLQSLINK